MFLNNGLYFRAQLQFQWIKKTKPGISPYNLHLQKKNWGTEKVTNCSVTLDQGTGAAVKSVHLSCPSAERLASPSCISSTLMEKHVLCIHPLASEPLRSYVVLVCFEKHCLLICIADRFCTTNMKSRADKQFYLFKYFLFLSPQHQQPSVCCCLSRNTMWKLIIT